MILMLLRLVYVAVLSIKLGLITTVSMLSAIFSAVFVERTKAGLVSAVLLSELLDDNQLPSLKLVEVYVLFRGGRCRTL